MGTRSAGDRPVAMLSRWRRQKSPLSTCKCAPGGDDLRGHQGKEADRGRAARARRRHKVTLRRGERSHPREEGPPVPGEDRRATRSTSLSTRSTHARNPRQEPACTALISRKTQGASLPFDQSGSMEDPFRRQQRSAKGRRAGAIINKLHPKTFPSAAPRETRSTTTSTCRDRVWAGHGGEVGL